MTDNPPIDNPRPPQVPLSREMVSQVGCRFLREIDVLRQLGNELIGTNEKSLVDGPVSLYRTKDQRIYTNVLNIFPLATGLGDVGIDYFHPTDLDPEKSPFTSFLSEMGVDVDSMHFIDIGEVTDETTPTYRQVLQSPIPGVKNWQAGSLYVLSPTVSGETIVLKFTQLASTVWKTTKIDDFVIPNTGAKVLLRPQSDYPLKAYVESHLLDNDFELLASALSGVKKGLLKLQEARRATEPE